MFLTGSATLRALSYHSLTQASKTEYIFGPQPLPTLPRPAPHPNPPYPTSRKRAAAKSKMNNRSDTTGFLIALASIVSVRMYLHVVYIRAHLLPTGTNRRVHATLRGRAQAGLHASLHLQVCVT